MRFADSGIPLAPVIARAVSSLSSWPKDRVASLYESTSINSDVIASTRLNAHVGIVGRTYLERGQPVTVLTQWRTGAGVGGPRNVKIRRLDGTEVVRPFRGLRKADTAD